MSVTLDPPRWKNGPPICPVSNLPAFAQRSDVAAFIDKLFPVAGCHEGAAVYCRDCGCWHWLTGKDFEKLSKRKILLPE